MPSLICETIIKYMITCIYTLHIYTTTTLHVTFIYGIGEGNSIFMGLNYSCFIVYQYLSTYLFNTIEPFIIIKPFITIIWEYLCKVSCDWLAADVTVLAMDSVLSLSKQLACYQEKSVTDGKWLQTY